ncbi:MAG: restriction endonuclease [Chitinophagaceae bacterium]|nr:restriction endonuclease [Chitinophagaceae bacterium]
MANKNTIRVAEFEKLYYDDTKPFKQKHWEALCRYQEQQYKKGDSGIEYYRILNKGIQFTNYVGVIQAGNLTIEVLPKTDREKTTAANLSFDRLDSSDAAHRQNWHNVLLQMLKECRLLQVNHVDYASLNLKSNSILEIYLELFLSHTEKILHEGLVKKYRKEEGNKLAMKGQLLFARNISQNLVHRERFYVRHTEYNRTNIYNQLLYKTLCLISAISSNYLLSDKVNRLLLDFPEMPDCKVTAGAFDKLIFDRKTERYKEALLISKMLLLNYRPDITGGNENVIAILFDMNELWEEFVFRRLAKAAPVGVTVSRQNKRKFWYNETHDFYKWVRPDIVVSKGDRKIILDTKWKIIDNNRPGDDDLKQMFVYNLLWDAEQSILLYPGSHEICNGSYLHFDLSHTRRKDEKEELFNHCSLFFLDVLDNEWRLVGTESFKFFLNQM